MIEIEELLFFDTFAHDNTEEINLDLVQFPKPVYVTEVRIIPLGARVQADFPGGVRLGATNPSQFKIDFFVNDLGKPGASTFETLGGFEYDQNGCINLNCVPEDHIRKIPTDGLVLRGWYTTITLAVYGKITSNIAEQIIQPVVNPSLPPPNTIADVQINIQSNIIEPEWPQETVNNEYTDQTDGNYQAYPQNEPYNQEFGEYYNDIPKDPRSYHTANETDWDKGRNRNEMERERRDIGFQKPTNLEREHPDRRERDKFRHTRSQSRDPQSRDYREIRGDREYDQEWDNQNVNRHERERPYKHDENYRREYERKRPRTPPIQSPKRPHTPQIEDLLPENDNLQEIVDLNDVKRSPQKLDVVRSPPVEETTQIDVEEFEPILSDEDILDDGDHYQELDYDYTAYTNNDDIIKLFTPGVTEIQTYRAPKRFELKENTLIMEESLKTCIGITDDFFKSSITKYELDGFRTLNTEIKEEFIHLCEKFVGNCNDNEFCDEKEFCDINKIYNVTKGLNTNNLSESDREICCQVNFILKTLIDWLKIALNYEMANIQEPAYKIRHIKCGVRLAEFCSNSFEFLKLLSQNGFNMHFALLNLYNQEFMALSIKLMILKALDTYISHQFAIEQFLNQEITARNGFEGVVSSLEGNGYKITVDNLKKNPLVRLKFALNSIIKKLNFYEVLQKMHKILSKMRTTDTSAEEINLITKCLVEILKFTKEDSLKYSQPRRFLPVASQFEISRHESKSIYIEYFKMFNVLQCFLILLVHPSTLNLPAIKTPIFETISMLLETVEGLDYLSSNSETINVLLKCLLKVEEYEDLELKSNDLGLKIAYKLQSLYHLQTLRYIDRKNNSEYDGVEVLDELHGLMCITFSNIGKQSFSEVLIMKDNVTSLLQILDVFNKDKMRKSCAVGYIVDLLHIAVTSVSNIPFLQRYHKDLFNIVNINDIYDDCLIFKLNDMRSYLHPFEEPISGYDISPLIEIIQRNIENVAQYPGSMITSLRIIEHLGISKHINKSALCETPFTNYVELKYKHVILQLFSLDGISMLTKILQTLCEHFEQPSLFTYVFGSNQGLIIGNILSPCVKLLKEMLAYVIQCQNTNFKDLTAIKVLLQTYNLALSFPITSPGYFLAQEVKNCIIDILLGYTQPISEHMHEKDTLNKTLWSKMCGEVIKYITSAPYTFMSGLLVFSELLPLPLPIQSINDLSNEEITWALNLRKLWSAHLHPHSGLIQDMINRLCISTQPQLLNLLRRICVQLADLAANSAIMIARGILDSVYEALIPKEDMKMGPCNSHVARLLTFLACLLTHNTIKCASLHLISSNANINLKTEDKYSLLIPAFSQVLKNNCNTNSHIQAQDCILNSVQSFCDIELTLLQAPDKYTTSEMFLANALPVKEHLTMFITMLLDHLSTDNSFVTYLPLIRTLLLLTEHDYGFYHLRDIMLKKEKDIFSVILNKFINNFSVTNAEFLTTLNTLLEFLRISVTVEESDSSLMYTPRTIKMTAAELKVLVGWKDDDNEKQQLIVLQESLKKSVEEDNSLEGILETLNSVLKVLQSVPDETPTETPTHTEMILPMPETLLNQFTKRTVFSSVDACDERLTARYWLNCPDVEGETNLENVTCDLLEICRQNLPNEYNIIKDVEKLCRVSGRIDRNDDIKHPDEIKLNKMNKPFVTPMRPRIFPRQVQQRSDLFRSRPPNTSRPPSLHVDDFVALETCGAQPTGPTGYNKISRDLLASNRMARGSRGGHRTFVNSERSMQYRQMSWWGGNYKQF